MSWVRPVVHLAAVARVGLARGRRDVGARQALRRVAADCASRIGAHAASLLAGLSLVTPGAAAQERWIVPERLSIESGAQVAVWLASGLDGPGGSTASRDVPSLRFDCVDDSGTHPLLLGTVASFPVRISPRQPGPAWLAWAAAPEVTLREPARFEAGLHEAGLDAILAARDALGEGRDGRPVSERSGRCAKALLAVRPVTGGPPRTKGPRSVRGEPVALAAESLEAEPPAPTRPLGLPLELVPLEDLTTVPAGPTTPDRLLFRLLQDGRPVAGALVRALRLATAPPAPSLQADVDRSGPPPGRGRPEAPFHSARTDVDGVVALELHGEGVWLLVAAQMRDLRFEGPGAPAGPDGHPAADYESYETSLVFELRAR